MISIDDFKKLEIRIGTILTSEKVPDADKLLRLTVDLGEESPRTIVSGIALHFDRPEDLIGKQVPVLTNLEPRTIRGIESKGMILAASSEDHFALLHPENILPPGAEIR